MGCLHAKVGDRNYTRAGKLLPTIEEPLSPPPTDARLPINARETFRLQKSWKGIHRKMRETGMEIFMRYDLYFVKHVQLENVINMHKNADISLLYLFLCLNMQSQITENLFDFWHIIVHSCCLLVENYVNWCALECILLQN